MPADHSHLTLYEAVAPLAALTGLRFTYELLRGRINRARARAAALPAPIANDVFLAGHKRGIATIRQADLPLWAAWLKE